MNWSIFAQIAEKIEQPLLTAVSGVSDNLLSAVSGTFRTAMVLYVAMVGLMIVNGRMNEPLRDTWGRLAKGAAVAAFLTAGSYNSYIRDFFLNGLPNDISSIITGSAGSVTAASFDHIWNKAFGGGTTFAKTLSSWGDFGLWILLVAYWIVAAVSTGFGFLVWLASHVLLGLFVSIGPLMVPLFLFPATRSLFERWIGSLLSMVILQVFVVTLLVVLVGAENTLLANIATGTGDSFGKAQTLLGAVILFVVAAVIVIQLPHAATAIAGGMHFQANSIARATFGRAAQLASTGVSGLRTIAASHGRAAQQRLTSGRTTPPGPSISSSTTTGQGNL